MELYSLNTLSEKKIDCFKLASTIISLLPYSCYTGRENPLFMPFITEQIMANYDQNLHFLYFHYFQVICILYMLFSSVFVSLI